MTIFVGLKVFESLIKHDNMKNLNKMLVLATMTLAAVSCGPRTETSKGEAQKEETPKMLVIFYSQTSNTKVVADMIASKTGADLAEIVPVEPYDGDFQATIERGKKELDEGNYPEIQPLTVDVNSYDVIFLGYPIWFGTYAPPVFTFLNQVDLSGKKVVPFCTFGSGGLESSVEDLTKAEPKAEILPGYGVRAARLEAMPDEVDQFLKANGFLEGEYTKLEDFPEQHPVSEEEAAIFDAAVGDYPMMHAQAKTVASRTIPDGTEYQFTAVDLPRENRPDMPPAGEMTVYVKVTNGATPVFTRVIR
jgi:flavodoxin